MKYLGIVLLVSFVSFAAFGAFGMHIGTQNHNNGCVAAAAQGFDCPKNNLLGYLTFHIDAYKGFSLATLGERVITGLLFASVFLLFAGFAISLAYIFKSLQFAFYIHRFKNSFSSPQRQELIRWLRLHENSPAVL